MCDPRDRGERRDPQTAQDAPGAIFSRGRYCGMPLFRHEHCPGRDHALENLRAVEDDVDAATPVDAQNAPTGVWKSRKEREIPTASTSIIFFSDEEEERRQNTQINCPPNRISPRQCDTLKAGPGIHGAEGGPLTYRLRFPTGIARLRHAATRRSPNQPLAIPFRGLSARSLSRGLKF